MRYLSLILIIIFFLVIPISSVDAQSKSLNLSPKAREAINHLSIDILKNGNNPNLVALKPQLDPGDYKTVKNIGLLPDSPFYFLKASGRSIRLFFTSGNSSKAYQKLKDGNERTLESLLLIEKANQEKNLQKHQRLIGLSVKNLDQVGTDFDTVSQTLDLLKQTKPTEAYLLEQEAFIYSGYYLKHQVLLQKQEDQLSEKDFLAVEQARNKHLSSLAHIIVSANSDPFIFATELSQLISPQVGTNFAKLSTIAQLRDLETSASNVDQQSLRKAQSVLQKEVEIKLSKLPLEERSKLVKRYLSFIHGNPIRQFQAYSQISKNFTSKKMKVLTATLKDKAAQNFKAHLNYLETPDLQQQFVATLFSSYPVDLRLLFYTEVQLSPKVLAVATPGDNSSEVQKATQLQRLGQIKTILGNQVCQSFGGNPEKLAQTRFYTQNINKPDILDLKVAKFLVDSIQNCNSKTGQTLKLATDLQAKINNNFAAEAKKTTDKLPTKTKASEILKEEGIQVKSSDAQQVAQEIIKETQDIQDSVSEDTAILEKELKSIKETISNKEQIIIDDVEPTAEEIVQKEEEIIEQIEDAAASGETSPLVEELPQEVQEEISQETEVPLASPISSPSPSPTPTVAAISSPSPLPTAAPTPTPTVQPSPFEEPTLIETVTETASEPAATPAPTPEASITPIL